MTKEKETSNPSLANNLIRDISAGVAVFLVALPLCLGIAVASGADPFTGLLAGIIGGLVVGAISTSSTSVSGPAAGLTAVVIAQIDLLTWQGFLLALFLGGIIQILLGVFRLGSIADFIPTSVIKGLLAAIGIILILKQFPHLLGYDKDPVGEMQYEQPDGHNTFSELYYMFGGIHYGALAIGIVSVAILVVWNNIKSLSKLPVPAPMIVVIVGVLMTFAFAPVGEGWYVRGNHLVEVPIAGSFSEFLGILGFDQRTSWFGWYHEFTPYVEGAKFSAEETFAARTVAQSMTASLSMDPTAYVASNAAVIAAQEPMQSYPPHFLNYYVYVGAITIALVASLETLLNLEAVDKLDPEKRHSPPNRELVAQGVGNVVGGLIGALPVTSVIVRSSVNIHSGVKTKFSTLLHGFLLVLSVALLPALINMIPLACLAGVLIVTGFKLASPKVFKSVWKSGKGQFVVFVITILAILYTDLLIGILIGLGVSVIFVLHQSLNSSVRRISEQHVGKEIIRIELSRQVTFLNRVAITRALDEVPHGGHVLIDARNTDYIDSDVLVLIHEFQKETAPVRSIEVSIMGLREKYEHLEDRVQFVDYSTRETQEQLTPDQVIKILAEGNSRFQRGERLHRDLSKQRGAVASGGHPLAVILSGASSRIPIEVIFDTGLGEVSCVRTTGNFAGDGVLGSLEFATMEAGAFVIVVFGHTRNLAVEKAIDLYVKKEPANGERPFMKQIIEEIQSSLDDAKLSNWDNKTEAEKRAYVDEVSLRQVEITVSHIREKSPAIRAKVDAGELKIVGAMYDVETGEVKFL